MIIHVYMFLLKYLLHNESDNYIWNATWNAYRNIYYIGESNDGKVTNVSSYGKHVSRCIDCIKNMMIMTQKYSIDHTNTENVGRVLIRLSKHIWN